jgi:hypothetical protein
LVEKEQVLEGVGPELFHIKGFFELVRKVKESRLYAAVEAMPKGVLQSCHLHYSHDLDFVPNYLSSLNNAKSQPIGCG